MVYSPLSNYKYDNGFHRIQSGPVHPSYIVVSSGIQDTGADYGVITPGPPNSGVYLTTEWRQVPQAVSGYWVDYENKDYLPSGSLSAYTGYRSLYTTTIANAKVVTSTGPEFGTRNQGTYRYYNGVAPSFQDYSPYDTPDSNDPFGQGITGGGVTHRSQEGTLLTYILPSGSSPDRSIWRYNPPVYCQTFTETIRSSTPGLMSAPLRFIYRGKSTRYAYNYGSVYYQGPEAVRSMVRIYSPTVNSSNQKSV